MSEPSRSRPKQVCCCCSNLTGCIVIACLFGIGRIIYATMIWWQLQRKISYYERAYNIFIVAETYLGLSLMADIFLLIGSIKKIKGMFDPWMVSAGIWILLSVVGTFLSVLSRSFSWQTVTIGLIIGLVPIIWAMRLVSGGVKEIDFENSNNMEVELRRL